MDDNANRDHALMVAHHHTLPPEEVIKRAEVYLEFLNGGKPTPKPEEPPDEQGT